MPTRIRKIKTGNNHKLKKIEIITTRKCSARVILLILGILLLVPGLFLHTSSPIVYDTKQMPVKTAVPSLSAYNPVRIDPLFIQSPSLAGINQDTPQKIIIPSVAIDVSVREAKIVNGYWEVFDNFAGWGEGSAAPNQLGNQVIFAHAREGLFLSLRNVKVGQTVYILTNSKFYIYQIEAVTEVNPTDIEVIRPTKNAVLTLYTCSGFFDSKRLIVRANKI